MASTIGADWWCQGGAGGWGGMVLCGASSASAVAKLQLENWTGSGLHGLIFIPVKSHSTVQYSTLGNRSIVSRCDSTEF